MPLVEASAKEVTVLDGPVRTGLDICAGVLVKRVDFIVVLNAGPTRLIRKRSELQVSSHCLH